MCLHQKIQLPEPQYLFDNSGNKSLVVLTLDDYNQLIDFVNERLISENSHLKKQPQPSGGESVALKRKKASDFYGIFKSEHPDFVKQVTEDKEIYYDL